MKIYELKNLGFTQLQKLLQRPGQTDNQINDSVKKIVNDVKKAGLTAALRYARKYDGFSGRNVFVTAKDFELAEKKISKTDREAFKTAFHNIYKFHSKQYPNEIKVVTSPGVNCSRKFIPIENVGLYVPGGSAVLPSTLMMLGIPAMIAGCKRIVVSTPAKNHEVNPYLLYAAKLCNITEVIKIGGAQGIALMAFGDKKFKKVDKIFGPGNRYVTAAKVLVSRDYNGAAIDMAAGPSEVLVIADDKANPKYVASDLLSQAEHGADSQVILITTSMKIASTVIAEIDEQIKQLDRKNLIKKSLIKSRVFIASNLDEAVEVSNLYAPEHLILNCVNAGKLIPKIINAGSVFIGEYSPESAGDYSSGTNHSLPTFGLAKATGGVTVEMFMKNISFQELTKSGLKNLSQSIITLAEIEGLQAHANAVKLRLK